MLAKLAFRNVKRQIGNYLIYFITVALSAALLFAVNTLTASEPFERFARTNEDMRLLIRMITAFVSLVTSFVLSYATIFMLRLRKKEFGMYLTLGMTRKDIQGLFAGILLCAVKTYDSLIESFGIQSSMMLFVWMGVLLVLIFLFHLALARGLFGTLLQKKKTAWQRTNTVILRELSGRMTTNSVLNGVFAVLLTFSVIASNMAFGEKVYSEESVKIACPYDVRVELVLPQ